MMMALLNSASLSTADEARGQTTTFSGSGTASLADGVGTNSGFSTPKGIVLASDSTTLFVADWGNNAIRKLIVAGGTFVLSSTLAGSLSGASGNLDGTGTNALFFKPSGVAPSPDGATLYVADQSNSRIRTVDISSGVTTTWLSTTLSSPSDLVVSPDGYLVYITDTGNNRVRVVFASDMSVAQDKGSGLSSPRQIAMAADGATLYVADQGNARIARIVVSSGATSSVGTSTFFFPSGVAVKSDGSALYVADTFSNKVQQVAIASGATSVLSGSGSTAAFADGTGTAATFNQPHGIVLSADEETLYVTDSNHHRIRAVLTGGGPASPAPTQQPVLAPTQVPVPAPSKVPIPSPTAVPAPSPTAVPAPAPTMVPNPHPTSVPIPRPSAAPLPAPTEVPVPGPTTVPTPSRPPPQRLLPRCSPPRHQQWCPIQARRQSRPRCPRRCLLQTQVGPRLLRRRRAPRPCQPPSQPQRPP